MVLKELGKTVARHLFGAYELNRIYYASPVPAPEVFPAELHMSLISDPREVRESKFKEISTHAWYLDMPGYTFGLWKDHELVGLCCFWNKENPKLPAWFEGLSAREIVLVDLVTAAPVRGQGLAGVLIKFASHELSRQGFERLWTWIWHSNHPSIQTFEKAGWFYDHFVIELPRLGKFGSFRLRSPVAKKLLR